MAFINELNFSEQAYQQSGQEMLIDELEEMLIQADEDLRFGVKPDYEGLRRFANRAVTSFADKDVGKAASNVQALWPELRDVTPSALESLKQGLIARDTLVSYRH